MSVEAAHVFSSTSHSPELSTSCHTMSTDIPGEAAEKWSEYKSTAQVVASSFAQSDNDRVSRWGERIGECARYIGYAFEPVEGGYSRSLVSARLCRVRSCPICQWRRTLKINHDIGRALQSLATAKSGNTIYHLTLTVRNCHVSELRETIQGMLRAWSKMTRRKLFMGLSAWVRSVEVTRGRGWVKGDSHPHIHCLLVAPAGWATRERESTKRWREEWRDVLSLPYLPVCEIHPLELDELGAGAREVLKYAVKPGEHTLQGGWLEAVALALDRLRILGTSANLKSKISDELPEEEGGASTQAALDTSAIVEELPIPNPTGKRCPVIICYKWQPRRKLYQLDAAHWGMDAATWRAYLRMAYKAPRWTDSP